MRACSLAYKTILAVLELLMVHFTIFRYFKDLELPKTTVTVYVWRVPRWYNLADETWQTHMHSETLNYYHKHDKLDRLTLLNSIRNARHTREWP